MNMTPKPKTLPHFKKEKGDRFFTVERGTDQQGPRRFLVRCTPQRDGSWAVTVRLRGRQLHNLSTGQIWLRKMSKKVAEHYLWLRVDEWDATGKCIGRSA